MNNNLSDISSITSTDLWDLLQRLLGLISDIQKKMFDLNLPPVKPDLIKATDAGPGVGCSNIEVKIRDAEMARIFNSDRVNRIHRARDDSGQNEAERSNASIGEALVDGGALRWDYKDPLENLSDNELTNLSMQEITLLEETAMEKNAWLVAEEVKNRIQDEPGPSGDFMKAYVTVKNESQFFFNSTELRLWTATAESKQETIPGHFYFKKIQLFIKQHVEVGELYMEFLKGSCSSGSSDMCNFCKKYPKLNTSIKRVPRPKPDEAALPSLKHLPYDKTPVVKKNGIPRDVDDYQPRAQLRKCFEDEKISLDNSESIKKFSNTFAVEEDLVRKYLKHLQYLKMKKIKRAQERQRNKDTESSKVYEDYNWKELHETGTLKKLKVPVLDLFLKKHNLLKHKMKKNEKVLAISAWLSMQFLNTSTEQNKEIERNMLEGTDEDTEESDEERHDVVIHEIGHSESSEDDSESNEEDEEFVERNEDNLQAKSTRSGRQVIQRKFFWQF